jgi:hypothetical protein
VSPTPLPTVIQGADASPAATTQPRLSPTPGGSSVCCPPAQPRQPLLERIFKSDAPTSAVVTTTAPAVKTAPTTLAKSATESAQPRDWRESWGKVEPWKNSARAKANPPKPDPATQPDPIKDPDWYRGVALQQGLPSKTTVQTTSSKPVTPPEKTAEVKIIPAMNPSRTLTPPVASTVVTTAPTPKNSPGGPVEMRSEEANAFWTPPPPASPTPPKYNAFGPRDGATPPAMGGVPMAPMMGGVPMAPMPIAFQPPPPPMPPPMMDTGVPSGMANAFTIAGTRRPIPADFGPPQHMPNAFHDDQAELQDEGMAYMPRPNVPPQAPGMAGYPHPPMPGMPMPGMPMPGMSMVVPQGPMVGINPLMSVPPSPMPAPVVAAAPESLPQTLATLKDALCPSHREMAAERLGELNWRVQPQVVESLMKAAREDPAASVRAACVHALAHMQANTAAVVAAMRDLKTDSDPHVRQEAEEALATLGQDAGVRQASHSP